MTYSSTVCELLDYRSSTCLSMGIDRMGPDNLVSSLCDFTIRIKASVTRLLLPPLSHGIPVHVSMFPLCEIVQPFRSELTEK